MYFNTGHNVQAKKNCAFRFQWQFFLFLMAKEQKLTTFFKF